LETLFIQRPDGRFLGAGFLQWQAIYAFHMPLFLFLSGATNRDLLAKSWRKVWASSLGLILFAYAIHTLGIIVKHGLVEARFSWSAAFWDFAGKLAYTSDLAVCPAWFLVVIAVTRIVFHAAFQFGPHWGFIGYFAAIGSAYAASRYTEVFSLRALPAGLLFFLLGYFTYGKLTSFGRWLLIAPLAALVLAVLPHLDGGCAVDVFSSCPTDPNLRGRHGVWVVGGRYGNLPIFLIDAIAGILLAFALARVLWRLALARRRLVMMGQGSFNLFVINGFVLQFGNPWLRSLAWPYENPGLAFLAFATLGIAAHLLAERAIRPLIDRGMAACGGASATFLARFVGFFVPSGVGSQGKKAGALAAQSG
jgi:fucose 4-O-acetylase-like acetyltransferase